MGRADERASLGRAEPWLRGVGFAIWAFVGISTLGAPSGDGTYALWVRLLPWLAYGLAYAVATQRRRFPDWLNIALLAVQAVSVLLLPWLGLGGFEGLLLAVVVAQTPTVLSCRDSVLWAAGQAVVLFATVLPFKRGAQLIEILGAYSSFSVFALLAYLVYLQERRARSDLAEANAALVASQALLVEGSRHGERLRISRELHDSLGHHLTALSLQLELAHRLAQGAAAEPVERARTLSRDALGEVRCVVGAMQDSSGLDLIPALRALAGGILAPRISVQASSDVLSLDRDASHALFRCVQEAITNSVKHASAENVWVEVTRTPEGLDVLVRDDGKGAREIVRGRGLEGIEARAAQVGGRALFECSPGRGFRVRIAVPA